MDAKEIIIDDLYCYFSFSQWKRLSRENKITTILSSVLSSNDKYYPYFYCMDFNYNNKLIINKVLKDSDPKTLYLFYKFVKCAKSKFLKKILETNNLKYILKLGEEVDPKYLEIVRKMIKTSKYFKPYYATRLLKYYPNDKKLIRYILKSNKPRYLLKLAIELDNKQLARRIQDLFINKNYSDYLISLASRSTHVDFKKIDKYIKYTGDVEKMIKYCSKVKQNGIQDNLLLI